MPLLAVVLAIAIGFGVLFFRPWVPHAGHALGTLLGAEVLSIVAFVLLLAFRHGKRRLAAVGITFLAVLIPTCEGVAIAHFPGGAVGPLPPSSVPLVGANLAVMVLAALSFRDDERGTMVAMLIVTSLVVVAIGVVDFVFR